MVAFDSLQKSAEEQRSPKPQRPTMIEHKTFCSQTVSAPRQFFPGYSARKFVSSGLQRAHRTLGHLDDPHSTEGVQTQESIGAHVALKVPQQQTRNCWNQLKKRPALCKDYSGTAPTLTPLLSRVAAHMCHHLTCPLAIAVPSPRPNNGQMIAKTRCQMNVGEWPLRSMGVGGVCAVPAVSRASIPGLCYEAHGSTTCSSRHDLPRTRYGVFQRRPALRMNLMFRQRLGGNLR